MQRDLDMGKAVMREILRRKWGVDAEKKRNLSLLERDIDKALNEYPLDIVKSVNASCQVPPDVKYPFAYFLSALKHYDPAEVVRQPAPQNRPPGMSRFEYNYWWSHGHEFRVDDPDCLKCRYYGRYSISGDIQV